MCIGLSSRRGALVAVGFACALGGSLGGAAFASPDASGPSATGGRYIVVYEGRVNRVGAETNERERELGFESDYRWTHALDGFAAELDPEQLKALRADPGVDFVSRDAPVSIDARVPIHPAEPFPPTGIRRFLAGDATTVREASGVGVAVIDTGLQLDHPDLNAVAGTDCIDPGTPPTDGYGHGTHVAGTIAGENDGGGVVGVAPGTTVYAVRVLDDGGYGTRASVICGIDWVTANAASLGIRVANMSLGGGGSPPSSCASTTDPEHVAICRSTAAGVNYAVSAGNDYDSFDSSWIKVPAVYPEVLTVTAVSDSDGLPGGIGGSPSCRSSGDDEPAEFSNWAATPQGEAHTIAAPGVCIRSSWLGSGYNTISGTSMAAPHIAGALALCLNEGGVPGACAGKSSDEIIDLMRATAASYNTANPDYGFLRDPLHTPTAGRYYGFMSRAPGTEPPPPPPPPPENDHFVAATDLGSGATASAGGRNVSATKEAGEPDHAGNVGGASVWYRWTAPVAGDAILDLCGSGFDTLLAVYRGTSVGSLTQVAADDNGCSGGASKARFAVTAGETYRIAVDGAGGGGHRARQGSIDLRLRIVQPPANDGFANAADLGTELRVAGTGTNLDASSEPDEPSHGYYGGGASVWYRWTAPRNGTFLVDLCGTNFEPLVAVYSGATLDSLQRVSSSDYHGSCGRPRATFQATAGTAYFIAVDGYETAQGQIAFDLGPQPPGNDDFDDASPLHGTRPASGANIDATKESEEPDHAGASGGASVWYRWTAPAGGEFTLDTCASDFDTVLGVYRGRPSRP